MEPWTIGINPLITLWVIAITGGVVCILAAANSAVGELRSFADVFIEKPLLYYGIALIVVGSLSWGLWDMYYAC